MQFYDLGMIAVLVGATLFGAWKGMAWQLASLGSVVASYLMALNFSSLLAPVFGQQAPWNRYYAMLTLYLGTSLAVWLGFRVVAGVLDRVKLKEFDRQVGAIVGAAKGVLLCVAITFFAVSLLPDSRERIVGSRSGYYIALLLDRADAVLPPEMHQVLDPYLDKVQEQLGRTPDAAPATSTAAAPASPTASPGPTTPVAAWPAFTTPTFTTPSAPQTQAAEGEKYIIAGVPKKRPR